MKKKIIKFKDLIGDIRYSINRFIRKIKNFFIDIKRWFAYYPVISKTYDFDYSSLLEVEYYQLTKLRDCISKYRIHLNTDIDIRNMNWALHCLEIVLKDGDAYLENSKWIMPVYVNMNNIKRFFKVVDTKLQCSNPNIYNLCKDSLRIEKAWHLYNKIRKEELRRWWD